MKKHSKLQIDDFVDYVSNSIKKYDTNINPNKLVYCDTCYKCCRLRCLQKHLDSNRHLAWLGYDVPIYKPFNTVVAVPNFIRNR